LWLSLIQDSVPTKTSKELWSYKTPEKVSSTNGEVMLENLCIFTQEVEDVLRSQGGKGRLFLAVREIRDDGAIDYGVVRLTVAIGSYIKDPSSPEKLEGVTISALVKSLSNANESVESAKKFAEASSESAKQAVLLLGEKQDKLTAGPGIDITDNVISVTGGGGGGGSITVDSTLSNISANPVQNKTVTTALNGKASTQFFNHSDTAFPYIENSAWNTNKLRMTLVGGNWGDGGTGSNNFDDAILRFEWLFQYDTNQPPLATLDVPMSAFKNLVNGGGTAIEVWKGNVGFGGQDTFFGAKKTADGDGQFLNGYPRLHNHGQDIHEVSGFSRDSRDDENVWSHRLLLPWDLAKANDTSYLMAGVVWNGKRHILNHPDYGLETTFVQPLIPENTGGTKDFGITHAIPCFENSPMYWIGNIIYNDSEMLDSGVPAEATKAVIVPWQRVTGTFDNPTELALKSDLDALEARIAALETQLAAATAILESNSCFSGVEPIANENGTEVNYSQNPTGLLDGDELL
jgi:hypothetical protein